MIRNSLKMKPTDFDYTPSLRTRVMVLLIVTSPLCMFAAFLWLSYLLQDTRAQLEQCQKTNGDFHER